MEGSSFRSLQSAAVMVTSTIRNSLPASVCARGRQEHRHVPLIERIGERQRNLAVLEIAKLGRKGLGINPSIARHTVKALEGHVRPDRMFSALNLVAILFVGMQLVQPGTPVGADFSREYEAALKWLGLDE